MKCFVESRSATLMTSSARPLPSTRPAFPQKVILCIMYYVLNKEHKSRCILCHDNPKLQGESWLGLENLYYVTTVNKINGNGGSYSLKVTMTDYDGAQYTAVYDKFEVRRINKHLKNWQCCPVSQLIVSCNRDCHESRFSIVSIVTSVSNITSPYDCWDCSLKLFSNGS